MKKKFLIALVVFLVAGLAVWKLTSNNISNEDNISKETSKTVEEKSEATQDKDSQNDDSNKSEETKDSNAKSGDSANGEDGASVNVGNISGFTSEEGSGSKDKSSNSNSSKDGDSNKSSKGMSLPYTIASTGMSIKSIGKYSGEFVENGSDKKVSNVLSILVTNTSNKDLQYGEIKLKTGGKTATFKLTNIPAGKSVLALEYNGMKYSSSANYKYADATYANVDSMPMNSNKVKVSTSNSKVTIKNVSGKDLGTVYVYYKNLDKSGAYLGGITYRVKFDNVKKGDTLSQNTKHFSKSNSKIVMVDTEK